MTFLFSVKEPVAAWEVTCLDVSRLAGSYSSMPSSSAFAGSLRSCHLHSASHSLKTIDGNRTILISFRCSRQRQGASADKLQVKAAT